MKSSIKSSDYTDEINIRLKPDDCAFIKNGKILTITNNLTVKKLRVESLIGYILSDGKYNLTKITHEKQNEENEDEINKAKIKIRPEDPGEIIELNNGKYHVNSNSYVASIRMEEPDVIKNEFNTVEKVYEFNLNDNNGSLFLSNEFGFRSVTLEENEQIIMDEKLISAYETSVEINRPRYGLSKKFKKAEDIHLAKILGPGKIYI